MAETQLIREPVTEPILLALSIDRRTGTERALLGTEDMLRKAFGGAGVSRCRFVSARSLGSLLRDRDAATAQWEEQAVTPLANDLRGGPRGGQERADAAYAYLQERISTCEPLSVWIAFRLWNACLLARERRDRDAAGQRFLEEAGRCLRSIRETGNEASLTLFFPRGKAGEEWAVAGEEPGALLTYCSRRLEDWGMEFRSCKVCGRQFLADRPRTTLCSEDCRKTQAARNKEAFDRRAKENTYDVLYKNACQTWRNRISRAGKEGQSLQDMENAFRTFKTRALERKKAVKRGELSLTEFQAWIADQMNPS